MQYLKVPDDSTRFFEKETLNRLSEETQADIQFNEDDRNIQVEHSQSVKEMDVLNVLRAMFMGFDYSECIELFNNPMTRFESINIKNKTRNYKEFKRQKGRIIGENGKAKRVMSDLTDANIQVHNDKVAILGDMNDAIKAREAVMKILSGSPHSHVYDSLEKYKRKKNRNRLI